MGHIKVSATRAEQTPTEWLGVGSRIGHLVNTWAGRSDIVAYVGPGAGGPTAACFNPPLAEVEVNVEQAFGKAVTPTMIGDLSNRDTLFDWPKASGAIFHEAMHARYSRVDLAYATSVLSPKEFSSYMSLEETRIERLGVENFPANRVFLRASALELVLKDFEENADKLGNLRAMSTLAALISARVDAGVLTYDDITDIQTLVVDYLGADLYEKLRSVWLRFQAHELHSDTRVPFALAREWEQILQEAAKDRSEDLDPVKPEAIMVHIISEIIEAVNEAAEAMGISVNDEVQDQEQSEEWKEEVSTRTKAAQQQKDHEREAAHVFLKDTSEGTYGRSGSRLHETRMPNSEERAAAVKIARLLEKAKYRERDEHEVTSILPPGRLRSRAIVQNAAYKAQGSMMQAEPWRRTVRKHTDDPTLSVGVMVDISGSMGDAMKPMATTAWVMSEASRRIQAKCAMVYYGQDVFATLKPGQHLDQVNIYTAPDGTEKFDKAFKALDGGLRLLQGNGARLLVIVSDGCYTPQETANARKWVQECDRNGVAVLWIPFASRDSHLSYSMDITRGTNAVVLSEVKNPAQAAMVIGTAAANALEKIGRKNAA